MSRPIPGRQSDQFFACAVQVARGVTPSAVDTQARSWARAIVCAVVDRHRMTRGEAFNLVADWVGTSSRAVKKLCGSEKLACRPHIYERLRLLYERICVGLERDIERSKAILNATASPADGGRVAPSDAPSGLPQVTP